MFTRKVVAVALSALTVVSASNSTFSIDPNSVTLSQRAAWCTSEINVCGQLCDYSANNCDPATLDYTCTCTSGTSPDMNEYQDSLPYYICTQAFDNCISANVGSQTGQANCTTTIKDQCGTKLASDSSSSTTSAASSTGTATGTATAASSSGTATSSSTSKAGAMPTGVQHLGNGAVAVAVGLLAYAL
ncbi:putative Extracellular membrane protein CFEM domain-containing protein [Seiridium cardinale]|uniref:Extracellular membrane protein CFEM domain-containing protein n=1 Tax=Seiridium cardinale TaxID=138064 RepID=A0ABR2XT03_9PEZI